MSATAAPRRFTMSGEAEHLGGPWAYHRLEQTLEDLEYLTFAAQPMAPEASAVEASSASA